MRKQWSSRRRPVGSRPASSCHSPSGSLRRPRKRSGCPQRPGRPRSRSSPPPAGPSRARRPWSVPRPRRRDGRTGPVPARPAPCRPALPHLSSHAARRRRSGRRRTRASSQSSGRSAPTTAAPASSPPSSGFGTSPACEDVRVPPLRRPGPTGLALTALEVWRRLPPAQRRQIMNATRKQAPRAAAAALAYWRSRLPRR